MPTRRSLLALPLIAPALAQEPFPSPPVRIIVPFPPGQATDLFARLIAEHLGDRWGFRVVVENRSGGAGAVGMEAGARAAPDGHTLTMGTSGTLGINPSVMPHLPYDVERDYAPVVGVFSVTLVVVANPALGLHTLEQLIARAKAEPGRIDYASGGPGTSQHLAMELLCLRAGIRLHHIPYRGSGPALTDVLAGNVKLMMDSLASALPHIREGRLVPLAVTSAQRAPQLPEVPTTNETVPGTEAAGWAGLVAPAGTPDAIIGRINGDVDSILENPEIAARMRQLGGEPMPGSPDDFAAFIRAEIAKWAEVARAANVRLE